MNSPYTNAQAISDAVRLSATVKSVKLCCTSRYCQFRSVRNSGCQACCLGRVVGLEGGFCGPTSLLQRLDAHVAPWQATFIVLLGHQGSEDANDGRVV